MNDQAVATPNSPDPAPTPDSGQQSPTPPPGGENPPPSGKSDPTLAGGGGDPKPTGEITWPEDWRQRLAGDDEKALKQLERQKSPQDLFKSYRNLEKRLSEGKMVDELPEDADEEQIAEWRQKNGIPEKPEGYLESLPEGLVFGEEDEAVLGNFVERMHKSNVDPKVVNEALSWYKEFQEDSATQMVEQDREFRRTAEDELREEWGAEYRANVNSIKNFLSTAPEGLSEQLMGARLADGSLLGDNPHALRWLADLAHERNPSGFVTPANGGDQITSIEAELDSIRKTRKEDPNKYWGDEQMQARELKLIEAKEKLAG